MPRLCPASDLERYTPQRTTIESLSKNPGSTGQIPACLASRYLQVNSNARRLEAKPLLLAMNGEGVGQGWMKALRFSRQLAKFS
jgi:hypothetical protein